MANGSNFLSRKEKGKWEHFHKTIYSICTTKCFQSISKFSIISRIFEKPNLFTRNVAVNTEYCIFSSLFVVSCTSRSRNANQMYKAARIFEIIHKHLNLIVWRNKLNTAHGAARRDAVTDFHPTDVFHSFEKVALNVERKFYAVTWDGLESLARDWDGDPLPGKS